MQSKMDAVTLRAHFDGQKICLDEPFEMEPDTELIVTVLPMQSLDAERAVWLRLSQQGLAAAYREDEVEYSLDQIKEPNPEYEGG
jgi:hypothetical protein